MNKHTVKLEDFENEEFQVDMASAFGRGSAKRLRISVLREAVEKLLEVNHLKDTSDAELECHAHRGWSPEIQDECENVLFARNALRMTGYLPG